MSIKLRELIRSIRSCKTASEERSVVAKECALIRTAFKEEDNVYRHRNIAKLLFMNMLGYPTHFGQIECLKLIASNKFSNKRIGYLGLTILLDENTDILMLVTNSIKNDLRHSNQYINGIALCALGNIANSEMCSALSHEILDLININNPYIKKKATMCAIRILKKTNDIEDLFLDKIPNLLEDRNHGVLSAGISLMIALTEKKPQYKKLMKVHINKIVKILKGCVMSGYSHGGEYDIYGITDPFLQVKILKLLKNINDENSGIEEPPCVQERFEDKSIITDESNNYESTQMHPESLDRHTGMSNITDGMNGGVEGGGIMNNEKESSINEFYDVEEVNSILAQVATNTDAMKNVGNAILYECVKTITCISKDSGLLVLAVNILGKFLQNTDNNIRYVGLCTLQKLLKKDPKTLHIYRNTIIECLKDQDISIRKKALEVSFALITKDSLKTMIKELLNYLLVADIEIKSDIVSNICVAVNQYAPNIQYLLDTYIKLFCLAGNFIQDHIKDDFISYLMQNPQIHSYVVLKLFFSMKENLEQQALIQVGVWCIGELGDLLIKQSNIGPDQGVIQVTHDEIFNLLEKIAKKYESNNFKKSQNINTKDPIHNLIYHKSLNILEDVNNSYVCCNINENVYIDDSNIILQYIVMCLNKLTVRFPSHRKKIEKMIQRYKGNRCIEIQQRACEFHELMNSNWDDLREYVLLRIPCNTKKVNKHVNDQGVVTPNLSEGAMINNTGELNIMNRKMDADTIEGSLNETNTAVVDLLDLDDLLGIQNQETKIDKNKTGMTKAMERIQQTDLLNDYNFNKLPDLNQNAVLADSKISRGILSLDGESNNIKRENEIDINLEKEPKPEVMKKKNEDILADLFGNISVDASKGVTTVDTTNKDHSLNLLMEDIAPTGEKDLFDLNLIDDKMKPQTNIPSMKVYDKNGIEIIFNFEKEQADSESTTINASYVNKSSVTLSSFIFEVAVPNYIKLVMLAASSNELKAYEQNKITQVIKITNSLFKKKPLLMKVRLSYVNTSTNQKVQDFINVGNFPDML